MNREAALKKYHELCNANEHTTTMLPDHENEALDALWCHYERDTCIFEMSPGLESLVGDMRGERWIDMQPLVTQAEIKAKIDSVSKGRGFVHECRVPCKDGKIRIMHWHNIPYYNEWGQLSYFEGRAEICEVVSPDPKS